MARTTAAAVAGIIETDPDIDLTPFIDTGAMLVDDVCGESDYSEEKFELIERWVAAHMYAIRDNRRVSETVGPIQEWYQYKLGLVLASTMYGQQAMLLDTDGNLAAYSKTAEKGTGGTDVSITHLGSIDRT